MAEARALRVLAALAVSVLGGAAASVAQPRVEVSARVDPADATIGDRVRYEITVTYPRGGTVELPAVKGNIGRFELRDYRVTKAPGRVTHTLDLASFTLGDDTLPAQRVEYRAGPNGGAGAADTAAWVSYTAPTYVRVKRLTAENATEISDIDEGDKLPGTFPWGLVALAAAALAWWGYRVWRKRHPKRAPVTPRAPLTPIEAAFEKLRALELARPEDRAFAFALSELLREYLGLRYGVDALEATTTELIERTASLPYPPASHEWLLETSWELDTVKYATGTVSPEQAARWIEGARAFLETTREPAPPAVPASSEAPFGKPVEGA